MICAGEASGRWRAAAGEAIEDGTSLTTNHGHGALFGVFGMLAMRMAVDLFPAGVLQLADVLRNGYWHARRLTFLMEDPFHALEWARAGADAVFLRPGGASEARSDGRPEEPHRKGASLFNLFPIDWT